MPKLTSENYRLIILKVRDKVNNTVLDAVYKYLYSNAYGLRLKKCHIVTPSKAIQTILSIFKKFMSKKVMDRVVVNESGEELLKYYSKDVLPNNYGGDDKTIYDLQDEILKKICQDKHTKHMKIMNKFQIDKSMCSISQFNNEDGIQGTFRSLNID